MFPTLAYAMGDVAGQAAGQQPNPIMSFVPLILMFVIFYFLLIRPQQKKQKEHRMMLENLKRGDRIITAGGIYGRIVEVRDDILTVELAKDVQVQLSRGSVAAVVQKDAKDQAAKESK